MGLQTISQVSKGLNISTRTLRYYEQIGLVNSVKKDDYAYRTYDEAAIRRLQQIIVLRKLRIPLKQIVLILESDNISEIIAAFEQNLTEVDSEISALSTIKSILNRFINRLNENMHVVTKLNLLDDASILNIVNSLTVTKAMFKEGRSMEDLNQANHSLRKLRDTDVRIVYLPPVAVAAIHCVGRLAEIESGNLLGKFVRDHHLAQIKPDLRHFGFNHPEGEKPDGSDHGYERWVTIPEHMEVQKPFLKKHFQGGLYAAHMIPMGAFEEWGLLSDWAMNSAKYEMRLGDQEIYYGLLEEHLNYINTYSLSPDDSTQQIDLLLPIKEKVVL